MSLPLTPVSPTACTKRDLAAVLDWWALAGVECAFRDEPQTWLQEPAGDTREAGATGSHATAPLDRPAQAARTNLPQASRQPEAGPSRLGGDPGRWPTDLPTFRQWWLEEQSLGEPGAFPRLAPQGGKGAAIMVIVPEPEEVDRDRLLSGPHGTMASLILRAMRVEEGSAYFASVLPRYTPLADWRGLAERGLRDIVQHHIKLVEAQRVLVFGRSIAGLFGKGDAVFCAPGLDELQRSAQRRQRFWQKWLQWMEDQG